MSRDNTTHQGRRRFLKVAGVSAAGITTTLAGCTGESESSSGDSDGENQSNGETVGASDGSEFVDQINVYAFGGVNGEGVNNAYVKTFEDEYDVSVNFNTFSSAFDLIPKLENDSVTAHVIENNPSGVRAGADQEVYYPLRAENMPTMQERHNISRLEGDSDVTTYDPTDDLYHVTKEIWAQGLTYNHNEMEEPQSWSDIYSEELSDQLTNTGFVSLAIAVAGMEVGVDFNKIATDEGVAQQIWDRIEYQNDYVYQWWDSGSTAQQLFTRESALAGNFWYGRVANLQSDGVPITYTIPEEGTVHGVSCWTTGVENDADRRTAEEFIDHTFKPEPSRIYSTYVPYTQPNPVPDAPDAYANNPDKENIEKLKLWDYTVVSENQSDWQTQFQKAIQG
jgi:spermidine/putrescine-binding protein